MNPLEDKGVQDTFTEADLEIDAAFQRGLAKGREEAKAYERVLIELIDEYKDRIRQLEEALRVGETRHERDARRD